MQRLTRRTRLGEVVPYIDLSCESEYNDWITDITEKLAEYEDLEEQGLLIKLPCKVGDMVWFNTYKHGEDVGLQPHKVEEVRVRFLMERDYADPYTEIPDYDFGKTVFLNKEEAEAKLRELEGSEEE